jgi:aspartyl-tRNA(Asn)/glutamyl-tRNA(Gln) amidotransferase subunit A
MNSELTTLTLSEAATLVRQRKLSPVELTRAHLERIEAINPALNCFITILADSAIQQARQAEDAMLRGEFWGPLHGLPIALKDLFETRGVLTTAGSKFYADHIPQTDARVVELLQAAGAIILGKLNMHEIALGVTNATSHYGACRNPWALDRISGGSSGGSAVALAAGLCLGALGSDTGGSIRIPAALCGVVGLKPTYGRVSLRGVIPLSWNLDHVGPMARCVQDVALLLGVIAGYDPQDPASHITPMNDDFANPQAELSHLQIALADDDYFTLADTEILGLVHQTASVFEQFGAQLSRVKFPDARQAAQANSLMVHSDAAAVHQQHLLNQPDDFGADVLKRLQQGAAYSSTEYVLARRTQSVLHRQFEGFFNQYDLLLTPTTPTTAPFIEGTDSVEQARTLTRFTSPFNLTGLPALSIPCGFTAQGLPVGLQIVSRTWDEQKLLSAAFVYEQATDWHKRHPNL